MSSPKKNKKFEFRGYPVLTCVDCGETKKAIHFGRRSSKIPQDDPKAYRKQCKNCARTVKPGVDRDSLPPVVPLRKRRELATRKRMKAAKEKAARKAARLALRPPGMSNKEYKKVVRRETRIRSMIYLAEKGCAECGERDPRTLEYDHKEPVDKRRNIGRLILDGYSWSSKVLRSEIRKCRILCANCHRKHTIQQQGYHSHERVQDTIRELAKKYKFKL